MTGYYNSIWTIEGIHLYYSIQSCIFFNILNIINTVSLDHTWQNKKNHDLEYNSRKKHWWVLFWLLTCLIFKFNLTQPRAIWAEWASIEQLLWPAWHVAMSMRGSLDATVGSIIPRQLGLGYIRELVEHWSLSGPVRSNCPIIPTSRFLHWVPILT